MVLISLETHAKSGVTFRASPLIEVRLTFGVFGVELVGGQRRVRLLTGREVAVEEVADGSRETHHVHALPVRGHGVST